MTTSTTTDHGVAVFAAAVRDALADLPREEVDELTEGLEADLADRAADAGPDLGDPTAYADELRQAAGIPPRRDAPPRKHFAELRDNLQRLRDNPVAAWLVDFARSLRPAWWVLRGWVVYFLLTGPLLGQSQTLPMSVLPFLMLIAAVVGSVQVGRGRLLRQARFRKLLIVVNVAVAIVLPAAVSWSVADRVVYSSDEMEAATYSQQGLTLNGAPVYNVFVYGPDGQPLTDVQLFDQSGNPLDLGGYDSSGYTSNLSAESLLVPNMRVLGRPGWNVVPLDEVSTSALDEVGNLPPAAIARDVRPPFPSVQPLGESEPQQ